MRQLRTCDFCGDEAVGTFEIVPPELNPTEAEQRRVVLCANCQPTLEELLEPLLARAGADGATNATAGESGLDGVTDDLGDESDGSATIEADADGSAQSAATERSGDAARNDGDGSGTPGLAGEGEDDESVVPDAVVTPDVDDAPANRAGEGVTIGGTADRDRGGDDSGPSDPGSAQESGTDTGQTTTTGGPEGATTDTPGAPRAYRKVLRLLQNREFPMARSEVEALAGSAYDLEDHEVTAIINHAVKQGKFELEGRQIRRS